MTSRIKTVRPRLEILEDRTAPAAGFLDPSFGDGGLVTTRNTTHTVSSPNSAWAVQVDEKIVVAGESSTYSEGPPDFAVARYNLDGTLDTSLGGKGWVTVDFGSSRDVAVAVALQPNGRIVVAGYSNVNAADPSADSGYDFALVRLNADGSLDTSFDGDGKQTIDFGTEQDLAHAMALRSDGKVVVSGNRFIPGLGYGFAVARLNTDGGLDNSFAGDGRQFVDFGSSYDFNTELALQPDGKVVLGGTTINQATGYDFAVARLNDDGSLDNSFDGDGLKSIDLAVFNIRHRPAVAVLSDGKIVVSGNSWTDAGGDDFAVARLNEDGSLDTSFDGDGWQTVDTGSGDEVAQDMVVQPDGKVIVVGYTGDFVVGGDFAVARLNADGSVDSSFDGDGKQTINAGPPSYGRGVALQPDGKIVVVGAGTDPSHAGDGDFELVRLNADGSRDSTFGRNYPGLLFTDFPRGTPGGALNSAGIQPDGKIVALHSDHGQLVIRYNVDGTFDTTFGTNGFAISPLIHDALIYSNLAVQPDGKIVLVQVNKVARLNADGSLDTTFGDGGTLLNSFWIDAVAPTPDGKIVLAGTLGAEGDFEVVRLNNDGSLDTTFAGDGHQTIDFGGWWDLPGAVAVEPNGEIVLAGVTVEPFTPFMPQIGYVAVARLKKNGSLDRSFDGDGKQTFDFAAPNGGFVYDVALQQNGKVVVLGSVFRSENGSDGLDYFVTRLNKNGNLDRSFDGDGMQTINFGGSADVFQSMALQPDGKIVVAGSTDVGPTSDFAVARLNQNGSLDTSFDADGKQVIDFFAGHDGAYDMALQRDGKIVVVGYADNPETGGFALVRLLGNDNKKSPALSISDVKKREGNSGTTAFTFTVRLSHRSKETVTVNYATRDVSAAAGYDYQGASGTLTFAPGETCKTVTVLVHGDRVAEDNGIFHVALIGATNAAIADMQGVGTIVDDEARTSISDVTNTEGNNGETTAFTFIVTLSAACDAPVTVSFRTISEISDPDLATADDIEDFVFQTGTLTFAAGETTKTITIEVTGDGEFEADETFYVVLFGNPGFPFSNTLGKGTILNDDDDDDDPPTPVTISISDATEFEGNNGQTTLFTFFVTLSAASDQPVTLSFSTFDSSNPGPGGATATAGEDFVAQIGTLTFAPGETAKTITIEVTGDSGVETDETFFVILSGIPGNFILGKGTILNDD